MQPGSYPFSSNLRVLCERGVVEYPFSAAPAADGGNIGGVDQAANRLRVHPADGPMRHVEVVSADPWAGQVAAVIGWLERGEAPTEATGAHATLALRVALAANRSLASGVAVDV
jgi:predicted dehydrogenase